TRGRTYSGASVEIVEEEQLSSSKDESSNSRGEVEQPPPCIGCIRYDSSWHVKEKKHGEVEYLKADHREHKMDLSHFLVVHSTSDLGKPVVQPPNQPDDACSNH